MHWFHPIRQYWCSLKCIINCHFLLPGILCLLCEPPRTPHQTYWFYFFKLTWQWELSTVQRAAQVQGKAPLLACVWCFSRDWNVWWTLGRKCTEVKCHFHHLLFKVHPISVIYDDIDLDLLAQAVLSAFSLWTDSPPSQTAPLGRSQQYLPPLL